jgi:hypothetical protein
VLAPLPPPPGGGRRMTRARVCAVLLSPGTWPPAVSSPVSLLTCLPLPLLSTEEELEAHAASVEMS